MSDDLEDRDRTPVDSYQEAMLERRPLREADGGISYPHPASRPKADFSLDSFHRGLLMVSAAVAALLGAYVVLQRNRVDIDRGEAAILILQGAAVVGIALLTRVPHLYNYPFMLTAENVQRQYLNAVRMFCWMTAAVASILVMSLLEYLGWDLPLPSSAGAVVLLGAVAFFIWRTFRLR